jgi:hypothetical protein
MAKVVQLFAKHRPNTSFGGVDIGARESVVQLAASLARLAQG